MHGGLEFQDVPADVPDVARVDLEIVEKVLFGGAEVLLPADKGDGVPQLEMCFVEAFDDHDFKRQTHLFQFGGGEAVFGEKGEQGLALLLKIGLKVGFQHKVVDVVVGG